MTQLEDETMQEFAVRVQKTMAKAMSVEPTPYTSADKIEYIKRFETTQGQPHRQGKSFTVVFSWETFRLQTLACLSIYTFVIIVS